MKELKKKLEEVLAICSECEVQYKGNPCKDTDISEKIFLGCGKWKKKGLFILDEGFYKEFRKRMKLKQVINDLIRGFL